MKKFTLKVSLLTATLLATLFTHGQDIDLVPGINYSYNPANGQGVIEIVEINACNNGNDASGSFDLSMYLYETSTQNYWIIGTVNYASGLSGSACQAYTNWSIDIDDTPGIPSGTYRLGVWVDSGEDITETDENNNAGLLDGNNTYSASSASVGELQSMDNLSMYPNPATDQLTVHFSLMETSDLTITLVDMNGREVFTKNHSNFQQGDYFEKIDVSQFENGVYNLIIQTNDQKTFRKIVVNK